MAKQRTSLQLPPNVQPGSLRAKRLERLHSKGRLKSEVIIDSDTGEEKVKLHKVLDDAVAVPSLSTERDPDHDEDTILVWPEHEERYLRLYEVNKAWEAYAKEHGVDLLDPGFSLAVQRMTLPGREAPSDEDRELFARTNALRARFYAEHPEYAPEDEEDDL